MSSKLLYQLLKHTSKQALIQASCCASCHASCQGSPHTDVKQIGRQNLITSLSHKQADKQTVLLDIKQALIPAVKPASKISFHKVSSPAVNES